MSEIIVKEEMQSSSINELLTALSKAQGQMKPATFNKVNPHFKSKYADLTSMWDASRDALTANGLSVVQFTRPCEYLPSKMEMITVLGHSSGQFIKCIYPIHCEGLTPQKLGSSITYARRYSFSAILGICSEEDDDGEATERIPKEMTKEHIELINLLDKTGKRKDLEAMILERCKCKAITEIDKAKLPDILSWLNRTGTT